MHIFTKKLIFESITKPVMPKQIAWSRKLSDHEIINTQLAGITIAFDNNKGDLHITLKNYPQGGQIFEIPEKCTSMTISPNGKTILIEGTPEYQHGAKQTVNYLYNVDEKTMKNFTVVGYSAYNISANSKDIIYITVGSSENKLFIDALTGTPSSKNTIKALSILFFDRIYIENDEYLDNRTANTCNHFSYKHISTLQAAVLCRNYAYMIQAAKEKSPLINFQNWDGDTALILAAAEGDLNAVRFLVEVCKADVNIVGREGAALDRAVMSGQFEVFKYLVEVALADTDADTRKNKFSGSCMDLVKLYIPDGALKDKFVDYLHETGLEARSPMTKRIGFYVRNDIFTVIDCEGDPNNPMAPTELELLEKKLGYIDAIDEHVVPPEDNDPEHGSTGPQKEE